MAVWSGHARDWAEAQEPTQRPFFESVLAHTGIAAGQSLLDIGCGTGLFLSMASARGASVSGIDASEAMLEVARERLPAADLRHGQMEALPFGDASFDVVTGFNSFQFAVDPARALREAGRVAKPGARIFALVWSRPEECDSAQVLAALRDFAPPPANSPGPFSLCSEEKLRQVANDARLRVESVQPIDAPVDYSNLDDVIRGILAGASGVRAIGTAGENVVREMVIRMLSPFRISSGGIHMGNRFLLMVAVC